MKKIHKLTFALGILAGCIGGAYAASVGQIDTKTADIEFGQPISITHKLDLTAPSFPFADTQIPPGTVFASGTIESSTPTLFGLQCSQLPDTIGYYNNCNVFGKNDDNNRLILQPTFIGQPPKVDSTKRWLLTSTAETQVQYQLIDRYGRDDVGADIYEINMIATVWEL